MFVDVRRTSAGAELLASFAAAEGDLDDVDGLHPLSSSAAPPPLVASVHALARRGVAYDTPGAPSSAQAHDCTAGAAAADGIANAKRAAVSAAVAAEHCHDGTAAKKLPSVRLAGTVDFDAADEHDDAGDD